MKADYEKVADAIRIEFDEETDDLLIVFRVTNPRYKHLVKQNWTKDIEFQIKNKKLVIHNDKD